MAKSDNADKTAKETTKKEGVLSNNLDEIGVSPEETAKPPIAPPEAPPVAPPVVPPTPEKKETTVPPPIKPSVVVDDDPMLINPVNEKAYARPNVVGDISNIQPLPEPEITKATVDFTKPSAPIPDIDEIGISPEQADKVAAATKAPPQILNPAMQDLDAKDKKLAAENLVDSFIEGYEKLHAVARNIAKISESKVVELVSKKELNVELPIPITQDGQTITVAQFINDYNEEVDNTIVCDQEFKDRVRPVAIRVFEKKGYGLTDEQRLLYIIGEDVVTKAGMVIQMKATTNTMLKHMIMQTKYMEDQAAQYSQKIEES